MKTRVISLQPSLQRFDITANHRQHVIEVMRNPACELADSLHFLHLAQLVLYRPPFGQIACNLGESEQVTAFVMDSVDRHTRPEPLSALPYAPAFHLESSGAARRTERHLGKPAVAILLSVEAGKMLSDNLVRCVMLDALGTGIPARHNAVGVEHEDRVICDALDEMTELTFALVQLGKNIRDFAGPLHDTLFQRFV